MKIQKEINKQFHLLGRTMVFMLILCAGLLIVSVGVTYARYREDHQGSVAFQIKESETVFLGIIDNNEFTQVSQLEWKVEDNSATLQFAVANGTSEMDYSNRNQEVQLCLIGSLGLMKEEKLPIVSVFFKTQEGEVKNIQASVSAIEKGTALYHSYGDGWLYRFYESTAEGNREFSWALPGGEFSYIALTVKMEGETSENLSLLQPLITAETMEND